VGRHAAGDGTGVDPIVAAALRQRPSELVAGASRHGTEQRLSAATEGEGGLGWPGEPGEGTGLGWPVDLLDAPAEGLPEAAGTPPGEVRARRRQGWRRLFGGRAEPGRDSSAA